MTTFLGEMATVTVDPQRCSACGRCAEICPSGTLKRVDGAVRTGAADFLGCIACGHCLLTCPRDAIRVVGRRLSSADFRPLPDESPATAAQLDALLLSRRSVRRFLPQEVERTKVEQILEMVATAPMGIPPSEVGVVVISGREKMRKFTAESIAWFRRMKPILHPVTLALMRPFIGRKGYETFRDFIRPLMDQILREADAGRDVFTYDAPLGLLFHGSPYDDGADRHIATTYAMVAAQALGFGSCMIGTSVALDRNLAFKKQYGIPEKNKLGLLLLVGYPDVTFHHSLRRQLGGVNWM